MIAKLFRANFSLISAFTVFLVICPLAGLIMMELGFESSVVGRGYFNYASLAYAGYAIVLLCSFFKSSKAPKEINSKQNEVSDLKLYNFYIIIALGTLGVALLCFIYFLVFTDALAVIRGGMDKGEFRATLGNNGIISYGLTYWVLPSLLAYSTGIFRHLKLSTQIKPKLVIPQVLLVCQFISIYCVSLCWGFKSTGILMMLPAFANLKSEINIKYLIRLVLAFFVILVFGALLFDKHSLNLSQGWDISAPGSQNVVASIVYRMFVLTGDVPWHVWNLHIQNFVFPEYFPTILAAIGDRLLNLFFDINLSNLDDFAKFHYSWLLNNVAGYSNTVTANGHNITGTPFAEGLMLGWGYIGIIIIALFGGWFIGKIQKKIRVNETKIRPFAFAFVPIAKTYFFFGISSWLNAGGITMLFHINVLFFSSTLFTIFYFLSTLFLETSNAGQGIFVGRVNRNMTTSLETRS